jgi:hypothetical protein
MSAERGDVVVATDPFKDDAAGRPFLLVSRAETPFHGEQYIALALTTRTWHVPPPGTSGNRCPATLWLRITRRLATDLRRDRDSGRARPSTPVVIVTGDRCSSRDRSPGLVRDSSLPPRKRPPKGVCPPLPYCPGENGAGVPAARGGSRGPPGGTTPSPGSSGRTVRIGGHRRDPRPE